jgi:proteasome lid subunit RPN8/RPN11
MAATVRIEKGILAQMIEEARRSAGQECCGLLAGRRGVITAIYPAPNALSSAAAFEIATADLFRIFRAMRDAGLDHLGIYHSHPRGENAPSPRDLELAYYPEAAYFILSPEPGHPCPVRAFLLEGGSFTELEIQAV